MLPEANCNILSFSPPQNSTQHIHGNDQQSRLCNNSEMKKKSHMISSLLTNIAIGWHLNLFNSICTFLAVNEGRIVWNYFNRYTASKLVTASKRSCGKVMFLHLTVILFTRRVSVRGGVSVQGEGLCPGGSGLCPGGFLSGRHPLHGNERAVRILLERSLV